MNDFRRASPTILHQPSACTSGRHTKPVPRMDIHVVILRRLQPNVEPTPATRVAGGSTRKPRTLASLLIPSLDGAAWYCTLTVAMGVPSDNSTLQLVSHCTRDWYCSAGTFDHATKSLQCRLILRQYTCLVRNQCTSALHTIMV